MKKTTIIFVTFLLLFGSILQFDIISFAADEDDFIITLDKTEVYDNYSTWSKIGYISRDTVKYIYSEETDSNGRKWYKVWHNGSYGYIYHNCTDKASARHSLDSPFVERNVILLDKVTVRKSVWGTKLGTLSKNRVKTIYGMRKDSDGQWWYRVWFNGGPAYILSEYTSIDLRPLKAKTVRVIYDAKVTDFYGNEIGDIPKGKIKSVYGGIENSFGYISYKVWYNGRSAYLHEYYTKMRNKPFNTINVKVTKKTKVYDKIYENGGSQEIKFIEKNKVKTVYDIDKMLIFHKKLYKIWYEGKYAYIDAYDTKFNVKLDSDIVVRKWDQASLNPVGTIKSGTIKTVYGAFEDRKGGYLYRVWYNGGYAYIKPENTHIYN